MPTQNTIFVFIPDTLEKTNVGFLSGFVINKEKQSEFYIIRDKLNIDPTNCIGYCGMSMNISRLNWLHINYYEGTLKVNEISCDSGEDFNLIFVVYDYFSFRKSELVQLSNKSHGEHFKNLSWALRSDSFGSQTVKCSASKKFVSFIVFKILCYLLVLTDLILFALKVFVPLLNISSTVALTHNTFSTIKWTLKSVTDERKISLTVGNVLLAKIIDIMLGLLIIFCISKYEVDFRAMLNAKEVITHFQRLLNFLMGSPVGLKLNYAFNNALGNFFLYHIALWRTFLVVTNPLLDTAFTLVSALATLGFSFQAALAADILTFATFHVYCIYVYAARLYGVQVHALLSLWKLFIGRKKNPLRNRVDSCQYSHHQLFVGTLAFTILLFLLPTTMLYYVVFTTLRLVLMASDGLLRLLRKVILSLPVYVSCLWAVNSPKTRGTVQVQVSEQKKDSGALTLQATLRTDPWWTCVVATKPPFVENPARDFVSFKTLLHSIVVGDLL